MEAFLDFEKPIATLEKKLQDLRELAKQEGVDLNAEIAALEKKVGKLIDETYAKLTPWQRVQLCRHPSRPHMRDYLDALFPTFMELHGDRTFGDDGAITAGVAEWPPVEPGAQLRPGQPGTTPILVMGHQKGRTTKQKMERNFGMARPEGYRKAMRLMRLAERSRMPILTFIDTPGAYPDIEAEERGQSQAIAESIRLMFGLTVPVVTVVIGEGGSGGALAIGVANRVLMMEYSTYSVISPEGCASILWNDSRLAERASERLKLSPQDLIANDVIDGVIPEPKGGAHRNWPEACRLVREALGREMGPLVSKHLSRLPANGAGARAKGPKAVAKAVAKGISAAKGRAKGRAAAGPVAQAGPYDGFRTERFRKFREMGRLALGRTTEPVES